MADCGSNLVESLESLWFFTNVLAPSSRSQSISSNAKEATPKLMSPIVEIQSADVEPATPKCGEFAATDEIELQKKAGLPIDIEETAEISKDKRRRRRKCKRKILGELDLWRLEEKMATSRYYDETYRQVKKMPFLINENDGLAMKQHLRSWAFAVACTVR